MRSLLAVCAAALLLGCQDSKPIVVAPDTPVIVIPPIEIIHVPVEVTTIIDVPMPEVVVQDPIVDEPVIIPTEYTATFIGRIIYESGLPVTDNLIMAVGDDWENFSYTDSNGTFSIDVVGDTRFLFSALSPFTVEPTYCKYITPLMVEESTTSEGFDCNITTPIDVCIETAVAR